jgi:hypothetical protein
MFLMGTGRLADGNAKRITDQAHFSKIDGVAKSPPYGVTAFFQDLDILYVCLRP